MATTIIIYALFKSWNKKDDTKIKSAIMFMVAQVIAITLVVLLGFETIENVPINLFEAIIATAFIYVFEEGLNVIFKLPNVDNVTATELLSGAILISLCFAFLAKYTWFGMSLFSIVSICLLMFICWKKAIGTSAIYSVCFACIYLAVTGAPFSNIILYLVVGAVISLLSKAERKGLAIGTAFLAIYCVGFMPTKARIYEELGYNSALMKDYYAFLESVSGDIETKTNLEIYEKENGTSGDIKFINPKEFNDEIEKLVNTPSTIILKEMLIGFILLILIPNSFYRKYEKVAQGEIWDTDEYFERKFKEYSVLYLNPGKPEAKEENKKEAKNTDSAEKKDKKGNKSNKKQNKKKKN